MSLKSINVKYPPQNNNYASFDEAKRARNNRLQAILEKRLEEQKITTDDIDTYWKLLEEMEGIQGSDEGESVARQSRLEIMRRLQEIDGTR